MFATYTLNVINISCWTKNGVVQFSTWKSRICEMVKSTRVIGTGQAAIHVSPSDRRSRYITRSMSHRQIITFCFVSTLDNLSTFHFCANCSVILVASSPTRVLSGFCSPILYTTVFAINWLVFHIDCKLIDGSVVRFGLTNNGLTAIVTTN